MPCALWPAARVDQLVELSCWPSPCERPTKPLSTSKGSWATLPVSLRGGFRCPPAVSPQPFPDVNQEGSSPVPFSLASSLPTPASMAPPSLPGKSRARFLRFKMLHEKCPASAGPGQQTPSYFSRSVQCWMWETITRASWEPWFVGKEEDPWPASNF